MKGLLIQCFRYFHPLYTNNYSDKNMNNKMFHFVNVEIQKKKAHNLDMHFFLQRCNCYFSFFFWSLIIKSWNALLQYVIFCLNYCQLSLYHLLIHTFFFNILGLWSMWNWLGLSAAWCMCHQYTDRETNPTYWTKFKRCIPTDKQNFTCNFFLSDCQINCIFNFWKPEEDYFFLFLFWLLLFYVASTIYMTH